MIYTVGVYQLMFARFDLAGRNKETPVALGRKTDRNSEVTNGREVWRTFEEAALAAFEQEKLSIARHGTKTSWIVMGVEANWQHDTGPCMSKIFPTSRELLYDSTLVEIEQTLI